MAQLQFEFQERGPQSDDARRAFAIALQDAFSDKGTPRMSSSSECKLGSILPNLAITEVSTAQLARDLTADKFKKASNDPEFKRLTTLVPSANKTVEHYSSSKSERSVLSSLKFIDDFVKTCESRKILSSSDKPRLSNDELKEIWYHTITRDRFEKIMQNSDTQRLLKMMPEARREANTYRTSSDHREVLRTFKRFQEFAKECENYRNGHAAAQPRVLDFEIKNAWKYSTRPRK